MDENKQRILQIAGDLFARFGFRSISMDDIAHHLGMSKKTLYHYFADKDEIVTLAVQTHLVKEKEILQEIHQKAQDAIDFLLKVNHLVARNMKDVTSAMIYELRKYHNKAWAVVEEFRKEFLHDLMLDNITRGIREGYYRSEINPEIICRVRMEEASMPLDEELFPRMKFNHLEVSAALLDHFISGIATEKGKKLYTRYRGEMQYTL